MKKRSAIIAIICLILTIIFGSYIKSSEINLVTTICANDEYIYYVEDRYDLYKLSMDGTIEKSTTLQSKNGANYLYYADMIVDENNHIKILVKEMSAGNGGVNIWVDEYDANLNKVDSYFANQDIDVLNYQYINGEDVVWVQDTYQQTLTIWRGDIASTENLQAQTFTFAEFPEFIGVQYTSDGSIYYMDEGYNLYCLYNSASDEYNKQIVFSEYGWENVLVSKILAEKDGKILIVNKGEEIGLLRYDATTDTMTVEFSEEMDAYGSDEADGIIKLFAGEENIISVVVGEDTANEVVVIRDEIVDRISQKSIAAAHLIAYCAVFFLVSNVVLHLLYLLLRVPFRTKKILTKQLFVVVPTLLLCLTGLTALQIREYVAKEYAETELILYNFTRNAVRNLQSIELKSFDVSMIPLPPYNELYSAFYSCVDLDYYLANEDDKNIIYKTFYCEVVGLANGEKYLLYDETIAGSIGYGGANRASDLLGRAYESVRVEEINGQEVVFEQYKTNEGEWISCTAYMYDLDGNPTYEVVMSVDYSAYKEQLDVIIWKMFARNALVSVVALFMIWSVKRSLRGLKELQRGVAEISGGNYNAVVDINSNDEFEEVGNSFNRMIQKIRKNLETMESISLAYEKFVPKESFKLLGKETILDIHMGDYATEQMSIMTIRIRNFHALNKNKSKEETFGILNQVYGVLAERVVEHKGYIESFYGGEMRAVFAGDVSDTLYCASKITESLQNTEVKIGILVERSEVMFGVVGEANTLNFATVSEVIVDTPKLWDVSKLGDIAILITEDVYGEISNMQKVNCRYIGNIKSDNKLDEMVKVYDFVDGYAFDEKERKIFAKSAFELGAYCYAGEEFKVARNHFISALKGDQNDKISQYYVFLCDRYIKDATDFDGSCMGKK